MFVKVAGVWKVASVTYAKVGGAWKQTTFGGAPAAPVTGIVSYGVFAITNPVAGAVYTATNVSGGGTATWDATNKRFTLSSTTSRWAVTAGWASGAPQSAADYMERRPLTYTPDTRYSVHENTGECGPGPDCSCHPGWGAHWDTDPVLGSVNPHCSRDVQYGSAPALINQPGYTNVNGEWIKLS
jgi:hypothetical protein